MSGPLRAGKEQRDASIGVTRLDQAQRLMLNLLADRSGAAKIGRKQQAVRRRSRGREGGRFQGIWRSGEKLAEGCVGGGGVDS